MHPQEFKELGVNAVDDPQMDLGMTLMENRQLIDEMAGQQAGNTANPQDTFPGAVDERNLLAGLLFGIQHRQRIG